MLRKPSACRPPQHVERRTRTEPVELRLTIRVCTIAITKADGDNAENARKAARTYENALHFLRPASPIWMPPVLTCSAVEGNGIREIWKTVRRHRRLLDTSGELILKRRRQALDWMWSLIEEGLKFRFNQNPEVKKRLPKLTRGVERGATAPTIAAEELLFLLDN